MKFHWMIAVLAASLVAAAQGSKPVAPQERAAFEVAAIKLTPEGAQNQGFHSRGNRVEIENETVKSMLMFAYGVQHRQIVGEPTWVDETAYTINGVLNVEGEPNTKQWQQALQTLLLTRFGLQMHREKRELSYFALRVNGTPKLVKAAHPEMPSDQTGDGGTQGQRMKYTSTSMDEFVIGLNYFTDRPVVNETGLPRRWDFTLQWATDQVRASELAADAPPGLFTAMKDQLGLKLEPAKGPVDVLMLDRVERPSAN